MKDGQKPNNPRNNSANYIPSLNAAIPLKSDDADWWNELCKKYQTKNHWPTDKMKKKKKK